MAEYRVPTQQELDRLLYMQGMQGKSNQQIIDENLARGTTIQALPENFFQTASAGARRVGDYVNQAGNVQQIVNKLFPSNIGNSQRQVPIPTSFNFAPKQAPTGEILPAGLQTQSVPVASILQAIKPADVLGISGAERTYGALGAGKAPQPLDVVDTLGVGAIGLGATGGLLKATKGLPVGMSIQEAKGLLQTAPRSEIGFYSAVEQAAMASPRKSATGQAFLNDIMKGQDVRADEIKWMGLDDYLKGKQNVTKQEVQDYIANNRVDVKEVQLGDTKFNKLSDEELINEYIRIRGYDPVSDGEALTRNEMLYELGGMNRTESGSTKFGQYTLPGGENYRELLLTMPPKKAGEDTLNVQYSFNTLPDGRVQLLDEGRLVSTSKDMAGAWSEAKAIGAIDYAANKQSAYKSSHFPQENILAHLRVNDRIDADGKKMLLIEEVQSDWHQAGRDKGYKGKGTLTELPDKYFVQEVKTIDGDTMYVVRNKENPTVIINKDYNKQSAINGVINELNAGAEGVPDAPFKDTWYQLALKRAIQHAAENGYDRIGLTTGKRQIERYTNQIRQNVDEISFQTGPKLTQAEADELYSLRQNMKNLTGTQKQRYEQLYSKEGEYVGENETKVRAYKGSKPTFEGTVKDGKFIDGAAEGKTVEEVLGKAMAKQITEKKTGTLQGDDLTIGGEGMKKYYDETYPKFLEKYGKKWGSKVGDTTITTGRSNVGGMPSMYPDKEPIRYIDITPEMKAGVSKGQPLFAAVPAIPAAGLLAPQEKRR